MWLFNPFYTFITQYCTLQVPSIYKINNNNNNEKKKQKKKKNVHLLLLSSKKEYFLPLYPHLSTSRFYFGGAYNKITGCNVVLPSTSFIITT